MIRPMTEEDLDQVLIIEKEAFADHWTKEAYLYDLNENPFSSLAVYEKNGKIIGVIGYYILFEDGQITTLAVLKEYRGQGIANELMEYAIDSCDQQGCCQLSLEVRVSNTPAINLYQKHGFETVNIRKGYYENGEDAHFMLKALGGNYDESISD